MMNPLRWQRTIFRFLGLVALGLAYVGLVMPGVPTLPFVLLATVCFMRSSPKLHWWLLQHRWFGRMATDFHERRGNPIRFSTIILLPSWISVGVAIYFTPGTYHRLGILFLAIIGSVALVRFAKQYFQHPKSVVENPR